MTTYAQRLGALDTQQRATAAIRVAIAELKGLQSFDDQLLADFGGKGYPRHISLAITKLEESLLWSGDFIDEG
jgi:hypothetical protein